MRTAPEDEATAACLRFGSFTLDLRKRGLFRGGIRVQLTPRPLEVLIFLVRNAERTVDKRELLDTVWQGLFVTEDTLVHAIADIRRALADDRDDPRFILTVPRVGYRFVAQVAVEDAVSQAAPVPGPRGRALPADGPGDQAAIRRRRGAALIAAVGGLALAAAAIFVASYGPDLRSPPEGPPPGPFETVSITRVTSRGDASDAVLSPDGQFALYVASRQGQQSLWMRQVGTASEVELAPAGRLSFNGLGVSRGGETLYCTLWDGVGPGVLQRRPLLGGVFEPVIVDVDSAVALSPDGERLAFFRGYPARRESALVVARADGSAERLLARRRLPEFFPTLASAAPAWSPDGAWIAAAAGNRPAGEDSMTLVAVRATDGATRAMAPERWAGVNAVAWLGGGRGLLVTAKEHESSPFQIWHLSYPGGEARRITHDTHDYRGLSAAADARAVLSVSSQALSNVWVLPAGDAGRARQLTSSNVDGREGLAWTPDGRVVYSSRASGEPDLWIVDLDGTSRPLTADAAVDAWPSVSPDGLWVVFVSDRGGRSNIWRLDLGGGHLRQLTRGSCEDGPAVAADGRSVIYRSCSGSSTLWRVPIDGGEPDPLTRRAAGRPAVSPDGRWIAAAHWDEAGTIRAALYPAAGGEPIGSLEATGFNLQWTPDGAALTHVDWRSGVPNLCSHALDGDAAEAVTDFRSGRIFAFDWSRDGSLAISRGETLGDVVLLRDLGPRREP